MARESWKAREHRLALWAFVVSVLSLAATFGVGFFQIRLQGDQKDISEEQGRLASIVEERQSAPVLAAGVPSVDRGVEIKISTRAGRKKKYAHRPDIVPAVDNDGKEVWDLVVPVWNVGEGLAAVRSIKALPDCGAAVKDYMAEPLPTRVKSGRLGTFNVPAGGTDQLVWPMLPEDAKRDLAREELYVIVRYTDLLVRRDRWTCMAWKGKKYWTYDTQVSGQQEPKFAGAQ